MKSKDNQKAAFKKLKETFLSDVIPVLEIVEFQPSTFSSHHFGDDGRDATYTFVSMQDSRTLDILRFELSFEGLSIMVIYNRIGLDQAVSDVSKLKGKNGLELLLMPFRRTEKEIHRWVPIPFLKIPKSYSVKRGTSESDLEKAISKVIADLSNDIMQFDIIRSEWDREHRPITLETSKLK
ncbi:hypothetical protein GCM10008927_06390 [Amylibacter ulvae]|uniref:Uncharacterized protein n=1 Tax=Paramylibacter ulvae TaxID=1651968 RepID=A0ABQ3CUU2_9RHOB|nr:hypothetical protein [Amylibacter ulvae]GHA44325.1 hypothetical protein GCM10008927_06390 [Amylibacter ulvae]